MSDDDEDGYASATDTRSDDEGPGTSQDGEDDSDTEYFEPYSPVRNDLVDSIFKINHTIQQESMAKEVLYRMLRNKQHFVDSIRAIAESSEQRDAFQRVLFFEVEFLFSVALWEVGGHKSNSTNPSLPQSLSKLDTILSGSIGSGDATVASILREEKFELFGVLNTENSFFFEMLEIILDKYPALAQYFDEYVNFCKKDAPRADDIERAISKMTKKTDYPDDAVRKFFELCKEITPDYTPGS